MLHCVLYFDLGKCNSREGQGQSSPCPRSFISIPNPAINCFTRDLSVWFLICRTIVSLGTVATLYRRSGMLHPKFMAQNASKAQPCCLAKPSSRTQEENLARRRESAMPLYYPWMGWRSKKGASEMDGSVAAHQSS